MPEGAVTGLLAEPDSQPTAGHALRRSWAVGVHACSPPPRERTAPGSWHVKHALAHAPRDGTGQESSYHTCRSHRVLVALKHGSEADGKTVETDMISIRVHQQLPEIQSLGGRGALWRCGTKI